MTKITRFFALTVITTMLLGAGIGLSDSNSLQAQVPEITAVDVRDKESLEAFVNWTHANFDTLKVFDRGVELLRDVYGGQTRDSSAFKYGKIFTIFIRQDNGQIIFHGGDPTQNGLLAMGVKDDNGKEVMKEILKADSTGAKHVEYCWDDPKDESDNDAPCKDSYARSYFSPLLNYDVVIVGGYRQDLDSYWEDPPEVTLPELSAADVVNDETLKQFVEGTVAWARQLSDSLGFAETDRLRREMRKDCKEGGHFKCGSVYLYSLTASGYVLFHGVDAWRESRFVLENTDSNGYAFVKDLIMLALEGGGYVEYYWDDPGIDGDEDLGSPKRAYGIAGKFLGVDVVFASGYYTGTPTGVEPAEFPTEFVLHGNYPNPFNPSTRIRFDLPERAQVMLQIVDILGREVMTLPVQEFEAGANQSIELSSTNLASGTYLYKMIAIGAESRYVKTGRMTLVK